MNSLVARLPDLVREWGSVTAARDDAAGAWRFFSWNELDAATNRLCGAIPLQRGERWDWDAPRGARRLAVTLALLHLGAVGALGGPEAEAVDDELWDRWMGQREDPGRLVRLRAELRPRDPALVRGGKVLDHGAVVELATRAAARVGAGAPEPVLVTAGADVEQVVGLGALVGGYLLVSGGADCLPVAQPSVWVCTAEELARHAPPPSRAGALGGVLRTLGRADPVLGGRLARVLVDGTVPPEAERLRERGVEVLPWAL